MRICNLPGRVEFGSLAGPAKPVAPPASSPPLIARQPTFNGHVFIPRSLLRAPEPPPPAKPPVDRYLRKPEVCDLTGLPTSTLYRLMKAGLFVRPHVLGPNSVGWPESAVREWCANRKPR
jgi:predicted DNA-binding transcriptional regulator AlpA